jgi:hypothetical protein
MAAAYPGHGGVDIAWGPTATCHTQLEVNTPTEHDGGGEWKPHLIDPAIHATKTFARCRPAVQAVTFKPSESKDPP